MTFSSNVSLIFEKEPRCLSIKGVILLIRIRLVMKV